MRVWESRLISVAVESDAAASRVLVEEADWEWNTASRR
jgi:hypothetical protein